MHCFSYKFFARATFSHDQYRGICSGYAANGFRVPTAGTPSNAHIIFCDYRGVNPIADSSKYSYARGIEIGATGRAATTRLQTDLEDWIGGDNPVSCP